METTQKKHPPSILGDVLCTFKFIMCNQGKLFKQLGPSILMLVSALGMVIYSFWNIISPFMTVGTDGILRVPGPSQGPMSNETVLALKAVFSGGTLGILVLAFVFIFMSYLMLHVRLYRFSLGYEDHFFSFGRREMRYLWNSILMILTIGLISAVVGGSFTYLANQTGMSAIGVVGRILNLCLVIAIVLHLAFLFPALSIDKPTSFKNAWYQMKGASIRLLGTMLLMINFFIGFSLIFGIVSLIILYTLNAIKLGMIIGIFWVLSYVWYMIILSALSTKIIANFYQRQVLDKGIS